MSDAAELGTIGWIDISVENAEELRDFYTAVAGWAPSEVDMGEYSDFCMMRPGSEEPAAGICHARGENAQLPAQWLMYIVVQSVDDSAAACTTNGGEVLVGPKAMGECRFAVIRDPSGATAALYQSS